MKERNKTTKRQKVWKIERQKKTKKELFSYGPATRNGVAK